MQITLPHREFNWKAFHQARIVVLSYGNSLDRRPREYHILNLVAEFSPHVFRSNVIREAARRSPGTQICMHGGELLQNVLHDFLDDVMLVFTVHVKSEHALFAHEFCQEAYAQCFRLFFRLPAALCSFVYAVIVFLVDEMQKEITETLVVAFCEKARPCHK